MRTKILLCDNILRLITVRSMEKPFHVKSPKVPKIPNTKSPKVKKVQHYKKA